MLPLNPPHSVRFFFNPRFFAMPLFALVAIACLSFFASAPSTRSGQGVVCGSPVNDTGERGPRFIAEHFGQKCLSILR
jgi:hypothetical protein